MHGANGLNNMDKTKRRIPDFVTRRICQEPPRFCIGEGSTPVVEGSTPIIAFGDPWKSRGATLGLNPGWVAFLDKKDGQLLNGDHRRHPTLESLGISRLSAAKMSDVRQIVDDCATHFQRIQDERRLRWFRKLEPLLSELGASYFNGTACHLDLVQWATKRTWSELPAAERNRLLQEDRGFLKQLLQESSIRYLLLNGRSVVTEFQKAFDVLEEQAPLADAGYQRCCILTGLLFERIRVIGWSTNIQSSFGVTGERRQQLAQRIKQIAEWSVVNQVL